LSCFHLSDQGSILNKAVSLFKGLPLTGAAMYAAPVSKGVLEYRFQFLYKVENG